MPVKRNLLFVVLTAVILALGFNGADIIGHFFPSNTAENAVIPRDTSNNTAVYLNENRQKFNPMSLVTKSSQAVNYGNSNEIRATAAAMITAMARYSDKSYIFIPAGKDLESSLKFDKSGYIYVEKWQYLNSDKETRFLDCIVWTADMSIAYIRFYSDDDQQLSGTQMNAGLDRLDKYSAEFYPYIADQFYTLMQLKDEFRQNSSDIPEITDGRDETELFLMFADLADTIRVDHIGDTRGVLRCIIAKYDAYRDVVYDNCGKSDNPLVTYWLPQYGFEDIITSQGYAMVGGNKINDLFTNLYGVWVKPSYSAKDGIIYQTLTAGTYEITVIYNVADDLIEGFYFPDCANIPCFISNQEDGEG